MVLTVGRSLFFAVLAMFVVYSVEAKPSLNAFRDHGLAREAQAVERLDLTRFKDQDHLKRAIDQKLLVRVPDHGKGFRIDSRVGTHATANRDYYRFARPYTRRLILRLGEKYYNRSGGGEFVIPSLVRSCRYQNRIAGSGNPNATVCKKTSHTTGSTFDILIGSISSKELAWMRRILLDLEDKELVLASEEHQQPVLHVMVLPAYASYITKKQK